MYPNLQVTLIDSLQKRVNYLNEIIKVLELSNIEAIHSRGEDYKGSFDVVTSRAVANIEKLVTYTMHLLNKDGQLVAMKGNIEEELTQSVQQKLSKKFRFLSKTSAHNWFVHGRNTDIFAVRPLPCRSGLTAISQHLILDPDFRFLLNTAKHCHNQSVNRLWQCCF